MAAPRVSHPRVARSCSPSPTWAPIPPGLATTATPTEDGSGYLLNGRKLWATNGVIADVVVVMAKVPEGDGHARAGSPPSSSPCD